MIADKNDDNNIQTLLKNAEQEVLQKQLKEICLQLEEKDEKIKLLETSNFQIQEAQAKLM